VIMRPTVEALISVVGFSSGISLCQALRIYQGSIECLMM